MLKNLGSELYQRVIVSYKSTLLGIAAAAGVVVVDQLTTYLQGLPKFTGSALAGLVFALGALAKAKLQAEVISLNPPKSTLLALLVGGSLLFAAPARAQDAAPLFKLCPFGKCFVPAGSFSGSILDLEHMSSAKSFQVSALLKTSIATYKGQDILGLAVGGGVQTGDITSVNGTALLTLDFAVPKDSPVTPAVGATGAFAFQQKPSVSAVVGLVKTF